MIPLYKPYMPDNIIPGITEILYSGNLNYGKYGKLFELKLNEFIGSEFLLTVNSYNIAMYVVFSTLGLKYGDEIIASPVSCLASNQPFVTRGIRIVWADINPDTGTLCPKDVELKITKNTKAIFNNLFCGYLGQVDEIQQIAFKYGLPLIDDAIEAFGSEYKGKKVGNIGSSVTIFSFQSVRMPNSIEGAALVFADEALYKKALLIRDYGIDRSNFRLNNGEINPECDIKLERYGGLLNELNSFIGLHQMNNVSTLLIKQRQNASKWINELSNNKSIKLLSISKDVNPNYWVFGMLCEDRVESMKYFNSIGYHASGVHINNNIYSVFNDKSILKGVSHFSKYFLAIPSGWWFDKD